eukprot:PhM_4_TR14772/c0_g1_i1/m.74179/K15544/SSU72; RNA polymerase II subunit A C-terminal domain phosphatase SSU72
MYDIVSVTDAPITTAAAQSVPPQWRPRLRLAVVGRENATQTVAVHEELMQSHLPFDVSSCSISHTQEECFTFPSNGANHKIVFPHYDSSYSDILEALEAHEDRAHFEANGDIAAVRRALSLKHHPESFRDLEPFLMWDVVLCTETSTFDEVIEYYMNLPSTTTTTANNNNNNTTAALRPLQVYLLHIGTNDVKLLVDIVEELFASLENNNSSSNNKNNNNNNNNSSLDGGVGAPDCSAGSSNSTCAEKCLEWQDNMDVVIRRVTQRTGVSVLHLPWVVR